METGTVRPIVGQRYDVADVAEAFRYLGEGHARANVVLTFDG